MTLDELNKEKTIDKAECKTHLTQIWHTKLTIAAREMGAYMMSSVGTLGPLYH